MKLNELRKVIREEVKAAVKEELQEMLTEAVKIASTPSSSKDINTSKYKPVKQKDIKQTWSTGRINPGTVPLEEMLMDTAKSMTGEDARNITGAGVQKPNFASMMTNQIVRETAGPMPGIDITKLDFVSKAKSVLDAANKKDKNRVGI